jgi:hypothetical protein
MAGSANGTEAQRHRGGKKARRQEGKKARRQEGTEMGKEGVEQVTQNDNHFTYIHPRYPGRRGKRELSQLLSYDRRTQTLEGTCVRPPPLGGGDRKGLRD